MNKIMYVVIVILAIVIITVSVSMFSKKETIQAPIQENSPVPTVINLEQEKPESFETISISGVVSEISDNSIELKDGESIQSFPLLESLNVVSVKGSTPEKVEVSEISVGDNVSVLINKGNSELLLIQILSESGEGQILF